MAAKAGHGNLGVKTNAGTKPSLIHTPSNAGALGRKGGKGMGKGK